MLRCVTGKEVSLSPASFLPALRTVLKGYSASEEHQAHSPGQSYGNTHFHVALLRTSAAIFRDAGYKACEPETTDCFALSQLNCSMGCCL